MTVAVRPVLVALIASLVRGKTTAKAGWHYSNSGRCGGLSYDTSSTRGWHWEQEQLWDDVQSACPRGFSRTRMSGITVWAGNYLHGLEATYEVDGVEHLAGMHAAPDPPASSQRHHIALAEGEVVTAVRGSESTWLDTLTIETSRRSCVGTASVGGKLSNTATSNATVCKPTAYFFGTGTGTTFDHTLGPGRGALAFFGGVGRNHMHFLGVHSAPHTAGWFRSFIPQNVPQRVSYMLRAAAAGGAKGEKKSRAQALYLSADAATVAPAARLSNACKAATFMSKGKSDCEWFFERAPQKDGEMGYYYLRLARDDVQLFLHASERSAGAGAAVVLSSFCARKYDRRCLWRLEPSASRPRHFYLQNAMMQPALYMQAPGPLSHGTPETLGTCAHGDDLLGCQWVVEGLPQDCVASAWASWGSCDRTCGVGTQTRSRGVLREAYLGGMACGKGAGIPLQEQRACSTRPCPIACAVSQWSSFTACDKTCGEAYRIRSREVEQPALGGGAACPALEQRARCRDSPCPRPCKTGPLVCDRLCSRSCGVGKRICRRKLLDHGDGRCPPLYLEKPCHYVWACPHAQPSCEFSDWGTWGACSLTCGDGRRTRTKTFKGPAGSEHLCSPPVETKSCYTPCQNHCVLSEWSCSMCGSTCGRSQKLCVRRMLVPGRHGLKCPSLMDRQVCNQPACPIDCVVSDWEYWGACSATCGTGTQKRHRMVLQPAAHGGVCKEVLHEQRACAGLKPCPVDCKMRWDACSTCTKSCGGGTKFCRGKVLAQAAVGGKACPAANGYDNSDGTLSLVAANLPCSEKPCPGDCELSKWSAWGVCSRSCGLEGVQYRKRFVLKPATFGGKCSALFDERKCSSPCPVDCKVTVWSKASACSATCGGGRMSRTRTVLQAASHSGAPCPALVQSWACNADACPVDCKMSAYTTWSKCTTTCGGGHQFRTRSIVSTASHGGAPCGKTQQWQRCETQPCPGDCNVSKWQCTKCSKSCEAGTQTCHRHVLADPIAGGKPCPNLKVSQLCNTFKCPIDCRIGQWGAFGACGTSCGGGLRVRHRTALVKPAFNGTACPALEDSQRCNTQPCPIDCALSAWSSWNKCSKTCGGGEQVARRTVVTQPAHGGHLCFTSDLQRTRHCNVFKCPIACKVSDWGTWGACAKSCGRGTHQRSRSILVQPQFTGKLCPPLNETRPCSGEHVGRIVPCPVDCEVTPWQHCSKCTRYCGGGTKNCTRVVSRAAAHGGRACPVLAAEVACNAFPCPVDCKLADWSSWSPCTATCGIGGRVRARKVIVQAAFGGTCSATAQRMDCRSPPCPTQPPMNCVFHTKGWGVCSRSCGGGTQVRNNTIVQQARAGGKTCPAAVERRECNTHFCPRDCILGNWTAWSKCDADCGGGTSRRHRYITQPAQFGGKPCSHWHEKRSCNPQQCAQDCVVSLFGDCTQCTRTCGYGTQKCTRAITVEPSHGGAKCPPLTSFLVCSWEKCAVDCITSKWTEWSPCPLSCGGSWNTRTREVVRPAKDGGSACPALRQHQMCNPQPCPVDCNVTSWSSWGSGSASCSATCGGGKQSRLRHVTVTQKHGGRACPSLTQTRTCNEQHCPVDCAHSPWTEWSQCSRACGTGSTTRSRQLLHTAAYGGRPCPPQGRSLRETLECNTHHCNQQRCHADHVQCRLRADGRISHSFGSAREKLEVNHPRRFSHISSGFTCKMKEALQHRNTTCQQVRLAGVSTGPWTSSRWFKSLAAAGGHLTGLYTRESQLSFGRPVYRSVVHDSVFLFYYQDARRRQWIIGSHPGRSVGWVVADSDSAVPQGIKPGAWQISDGHQWYRDSRIGVTCADFCEHLVVAGQAGLAQSRLMGNYFLYEKRAHGRPIYQFSDKKHYLYFHESTQLQQHSATVKRQQWIVSDTLGSQTGFLVAESSAYLPQDIRGPWLAADGNHWVRASTSFSVKCGRGCSCTCDKHPGCCYRPGAVLRNKALEGNTYHNVASHEHCCSLCSGQPKCGSWQFSSHGLCVLKRGEPQYTPSPVAATAGTLTWAGPRSGVACGAGESEPGVSETKHPHYEACVKHASVQQCRSHAGCHWKVMGGSGICVGLTRRQVANGVESWHVRNVAQEMANL